MKLTTLLFSTIVAVLVGAIHGFITLYSEYFYLDAGLAVLSGTGIAKFLRYRSRKDGTNDERKFRRQATLFTVLALLVSWVAWIYTARSSGYFSSFSIYLENSGTVAGIPIQAPFLYVFWVIEAGIFIGSSLKPHQDVSGRVLFCEHCKSWKRKKSKLSLMEPENLFEFTKSVEEGDFSVLGNLKNWDQKKADHLQVELYCCKTCEGNYLIRILTLSYPVIDYRKISKETYFSILDQTRVGGY